MPDNYDAKKSGVYLLICTSYNAAYETRMEHQNSEELTGSKINFSSLNSWLHSFPDKFEEIRARIPAKHLCLPKQNNK